MSFLIVGFRRGGGTAAEETLQSDDVVRPTEGRTVEAGFVETADDVVAEGVVEGAAVNGLAIIIFISSIFIVPVQCFFVFVEEASGTCST